MHFGAVKWTILNDRLMNSLSLPTSPGGERDVDPRESGFANRDRTFPFNSQIFGVLTSFCWMWVSRAGLTSATDSDSTWAWKKYWEVAWFCEDGIMNAKVQLELNMARDAGNNNQDFYRPGKGQRKNLPRKSKTGKLITIDEGLNNQLFFATIFMETFLPHLSWGWTMRRGQKDQNPSHHKRIAGSKTLEEPGCL